MPRLPSRRSFLAGLSAASSLSLIAPAGHAEPPPEVTSVRLPVFVNLSDCQAPLYIAETLLKNEGITDVQWVGIGAEEGSFPNFTLISEEAGPDSSDWIGHGDIDFDWNFPSAHMRLLANGVPIKVLAGMHSGCLELFARETIRSVGGLKGKKVGVDAQLGIPHLMLIVFAASVGLDHQKDIEWVTAPNFNPIELFADGKIDAFLGGPPLPQEMRERKLGHVILNTGVDRPWSQYFCCMMSATSRFAEANPIATKRILRAILKSVDFCVSDPQQAARTMVENGFASRYDYALQAVSEGRYNTWRDHDPGDSLRFWGLRLRDCGIIAGNPNELIERGTDWSFLDELKRELKS